MQPYFEDQRRMSFTRHIRLNSIPLAEDVYQDCLKVLLFDSAG